MLPFFRKAIFLKTATHFFKYFYIENKEVVFYLYQIENFGRVDVPFLATTFEGI